MWRSNTTKKFIEAKFVEKAVKKAKKNRKKKRINRLDTGKGKETGRIPEDDFLK